MIPTLYASCPIEVGRIDRVLAELAVVMGVDADAFHLVAFIPHQHCVAFLKLRLRAIGRAEESLVACEWNALHVNAVEAGVILPVGMRIELAPPLVVIAFADEDAVEWLELMLHLFQFSIFRATSRRGC